MPRRRITRLDHAPLPHEDPEIPLAIEEARATRDGQQLPFHATEREKTALQIAVPGRQERQTMASRSTGNQPDQTGRLEQGGQSVPPTASGAEHGWKTASRDLMGSTPRKDVR